MREVFKEADTICEDLCRAVLQALGIGPEVIHSELKKLLDGAKSNLGTG